LSGFPKHQLADLNSTSFDLLISKQLSLFVAALDATIVSTAAPTISRDLNSAAGYTWIGGAFLLANAASGPIWATLSDIWGRRPIILFALAMFFASSAVCATAKTMETLIVGRAFQGAAGGGLILLVHVCISDLFSLRQRSLLMGFTEGIWALAGGIGPVMGGVFASLVSWRWCCKFEKRPIST
jgi:MFS family permease